MARQFSRASTQYLNNSSPATSGTVVSMWCRAWVNDLTQNHALIGLYKSSGGGTEQVKIAISALGGAAGDKLQAAVQNNSVIASAVTSGAYTEDAWMNIGASFDLIGGTWTARMYYSGSVVTDTGSGGSLGQTDTFLGAGSRANGGIIITLDGRLAECAMWDATILNADWPELEAGLCPLAFGKYRANLIGYWPLGGVYSANDADTDVLGGFDMTPSGSPTTADHPTDGLFYPSPSRLIVPAAAAPPAGGIQVLRRRIEAA